MKPAAILLALILAACQHGETRDIETIWRVVDGDTVVFLDGSKARLAWIDAPEIKQPYGVEAMFALADLIPPDTKVLVIEHGKDRYGRRIVTLYKEQVDVNFLILRGGWAWHYVKYARDGQSKDDFIRYSEAESQAIRDRLGLWRDKHPVAPWNWRKHQRISCGPVGEPPRVDFGWVYA